MPKKAKRQLDRQLGEDNSKAVRVYVKSQLKKRGEKLNDLADQIRTMRQQLGDVNVPDLNNRLNAAARAVLGDINDYNQQRERVTGGQDLSPTEQARLDQPPASEEVIGQLREDVDALRRDVDRHESILTVTPTGNRPPSRFDAIENDVTRLTASVEGLAVEVRNPALQYLITRFFWIWGGLAVVYLVLWVVFDSLDWTWTGQIFGTAVFAAVISLALAWRETRRENNALNQRAVQPAQAPVVTNNVPADAES